MNPAASLHGLYGPPEQRLLMMGRSAELAHALRAEDFSQAERLLADPALSILGVGDAVMGRTELFKVPWSVVPEGAVGRTDIMIVSRGQGIQTPNVRHLTTELAKRGASAQEVGLGKLTFGHGQMYVDGVPRALPQAIVPMHVQAEDAPMIGYLQDLGIHVVNGPDAVLAGRDKNVMAKIWNRDGVSIPHTITDLHTLDDVVRAGKELGYPAVLKHPQSAVSRGVAGVASARKAQRMARQFGLREINIGTTPLLMQEMSDFGKADVRMHGARDVMTGERRIIGAYHRVSASKDFRANGGDGGNYMRPILDLSGNDPALPQSLIDEFLRAGKSGTLDWFSGDGAIETKTGRPIMIEVDNWSNPIENAVPIPYEQGSFRRLADLLVYGDRSRWID